MRAHYQTHLEEGKEPNEFMFMEPVMMIGMIMTLVIFGVKLKDNLGVFTEGRYLYYWERQAYDIKFGMNYQFIGW